MGRYKWALIGGTLIALALVVVVLAQYAQAGQEASERVGAYLTLQTFCQTNVFDVGDDRCQQWTSDVLNSGSDYAAVDTCYETYMQGARPSGFEFADCLQRNGFTAPLK